MKDKRYNLYKRLVTMLLIGMLSLMASIPTFARIDEKCLTFPVSMKCNHGKEYEFFQLWNTYRRNNGVDELILHPVLNRYVQIRLADQCFIAGGHVKLSGMSMEEIFSSIGVTMNGIHCPEDIYQGSTSPQSCLDGFVRDIHRADIIDPSTKYCGVAMDENTGAWVIISAAEKDLYGPNVFPAPTSAPITSGTETVNMNVEIMVRYLNNLQARAYYSGNDVEFGKTTHIDAYIQAGSDFRRYLVPINMYTMTNETPDMITLTHNNAGYSVTPKKAGTAKVRITMNQDTSVSQTADIVVNPQTLYNTVGLDNVKITLEKTSYPYTGQQVKPVVKSVIDHYGNSMIEGTDYTVSYKNNIDKGTGTVVVNGIGGYEGYKSAYFQIIEGSSSDSSGSGNQGGSGNSGSGSSGSSGETTHPGGSGNSGNEETSSGSDSAGGTGSGSTGTTGTKPSKEDDAPGYDYVRIEPLPAGSKFTVNNASYKVLKNGTVSIIGVNANLGKFTIPSDIKYNGMGYIVSNIAKNTFRNCKKLKSVVIPKTVVKIGPNAFLGCSKLKKITIKTKTLTTKSVGGNAFKGVYKKCSIKVPKKCLKKYKTLLRKRGATKKMKIY